MLPLISTSYHARKAPAFLIETHSFRGSGKQETNAEKIDLDVVNICCDFTDAQFTVTVTKRWMPYVNRRHRQFNVTRWQSVVQRVIKARIYYKFRHFHWSLRFLGYRYLQWLTITSDIIGGILHFLNVIALESRYYVHFISSSTRSAVLTDLGCFLGRYYLWLKAVKLNNIILVRFVAWAFLQPRALQRNINYRVLTTHTFAGWSTSSRMNVTDHF